MPAIVISQCHCLQDKTVSFKERKKYADPNCLQCKGFGSYETEDHRAKRAIAQRDCDDVLDKIEAMYDAGISWEVMNSMSDEEFVKWTPNTDSSHWIEESERLQKAEALEQEKQKIEFAKMEKGNKIAREKLRQIRRNLNSFEKGGATMDLKIRVVKSHATCSNCCETYKDHSDWEKLVKMDRRIPKGETALVVKLGYNSRDFCLCHVHAMPFLESLNEVYEQAKEMGWGDDN